MKNDASLLASLIEKGTPEERAAYNRIAMAHNKKLDNESAPDLAGINYELGQSVNRLACLTDYFDDVDRTIEGYQKAPGQEKAALLGYTVMLRWEQFKTLVFDAKAGVQDQIQSLAHYE